MSVANKLLPLVLSCFSICLSGAASNSLVYAKEVVKVEEESTLTETSKLKEKVESKSKNSNKEKVVTSKSKLPKTAVFKTTKGDITVSLYTTEAPITVENFVKLARGEKEWNDPSGKKMVKTPLYNGTIFHRVIKDFMIQGGDPRGDGTGHPIESFQDEFSPTRSFDKKGKLAMANAGPNTNASQFFITTAPTPWLTGKHTIFGEVIKGIEVVDAIQNVPTGLNDRPKEDIKVSEIQFK